MTAEPLSRLSDTARAGLLLGVYYPARAALRAGLTVQELHREIEAARDAVPVASDEGRDGPPYKPGSHAAAARAALDQTQASTEGNDG